MDDFYAFIHDDITWCGNECSYTECERNQVHRLSQNGYFTAALFKDTEACPLHQKNEEDHHD